jgi:hypothetical protein
MKKIAQNLPFGNEIIQRDLDSDGMEHLSPDEKRKKAEELALKKLTGHYGADSFMNIDEESQ